MFQAPAALVDVRASKGEYAGAITHAQRCPEIDNLSNEIEARVESRNRR